MNEFKLPEAFCKWAYDERAEMVRRMASGDEIPHETIFLSFTRHNPAFISQGPAGLNGSMKGIGFIPKTQYLEDTLEAYLRHIDRGWREGYSQEGLELLVKYLWSPEAKSRVDFSIMGSLEMAKKHTWANFQANKEVTSLFFQPPRVSFEVRGEIEIVTEGPYHLFLNAQPTSTTGQTRKDGRASQPT